MFNCIFSCFGYDIEIQDADLDGRFWAIETDEIKDVRGKKIQLQEFKVNAIYEEQSRLNDQQHPNELKPLIKK